MISSGSRSEPDARAKHRWITIQRFQPPKRRLSNELVTPGRGKDYIESRSAAGVGELDRSGRERLDEGVVPDNGYRECVARLVGRVFRWHSMVQSSPLLVS